jgi:hypothetical protein
LLPQEKLCDRGCGLVIWWGGKDPDKRGSTGWYEKDNMKIEHTYSRCDKIIKENKILAEKMQGQTTL